eukprot:Hpha_TRINITY_DN15443_c2_g11::TRINITY_DN15443_c2_g11_i1::g.174011::m.174011
MPRGWPGGPLTHNQSAPLLPRGDDDLSSPEAKFPTPTFSPVTSAKRAKSSSLAAPATARQNSDILPSVKLTPFGQWVFGNRGSGQTQLPPTRPDAARARPGSETRDQDKPSGQEELSQVMDRLSIQIPRNLLNGAEIRCLHALSWVSFAFLALWLLRPVSHALGIATVVSLLMFHHDGPPAQRYFINQQAEVLQEWKKKTAEWERRRKDAGCLRLRRFLRCYLVGFGVKLWTTSQVWLLVPNRICWMLGLSHLSSKLFHTIPNQKIPSDKAVWIVDFILGCGVIVLFFWRTSTLSVVGVLVSLALGLTLVFAVFCEYSTQANVLTRLCDAFLFLSVFLWLCWTLADEVHSAIRPIYSLIPEEETYTPSTPFQKQSAEQIKLIAEPVLAHMNISLDEVYRTMSQVLGELNQVQSMLETGGGRRPSLEDELEEVCPNPWSTGHWWGWVRQVYASGGFDDVRESIRRIHKSLVSTFEHKTLEQGSEVLSAVIRSTIKLLLAILSATKSTLTWVTDMMWQGSVCLAFLYALRSQKHTPLYYLFIKLASEEEGATDMEIVVCELLRGNVMTVLHMFILHFAITYFPLAIINSGVACSLALLAGLIATFPYFPKFWIPAAYAIFVLDWWEPDLDGDWFGDWLCSVWCSLPSILQTFLPSFVLGWWGPHSSNDDRFCSPLCSLLRRDRLVTVGLLLWTVATGYVGDKWLWPDSTELARKKENDVREHGERKGDRTEPKDGRGEKKCGGGKRKKEKKGGSVDRERHNTTESTVEQIKEEETDWTELQKSLRSLFPLLSIVGMEVWGIWGIVLAPLLFSAALELFYRLPIQSEDALLDSVQSQTPHRDTRSREGSRAGTSRERALSPNRPDVQIRPLRMTPSPPLSDVSTPR